MNYRHKVEQVFHEDPALLDEITAGLAVEAADKFREALGWVVAHGDKRANVAARAATVGYLFGYMTIDQAAAMGNCDRRMITKLKVKLCDAMGVTKVYQQPIRRK